MVDLDVGHLWLVMNWLWWVVHWLHWVLHWVLLHWLSIRLHRLLGQLSVVFSDSDASFDEEADKDSSNTDSKNDAAVALIVRKDLASHFSLFGIGLLSVVFLWLFLVFFMMAMVFLLVLLLFGFLNCGFLNCF